MVESKPLINIDEYRVVESKPVIDVDECGVVESKPVMISLNSLIDIPKTLIMHKRINLKEEPKMAIVEKDLDLKSIYSIKSKMIEKIAPE